ncbi:MAG: winged helix-turn-helix transcriptional regulator [Gemmatimonadales bacterium]|nr:winged helix-turn-helix transcriptional regulator [Gemmatimonadales bacterium]
MATARQQQMRSEVDRYRALADETRLRVLLALVGREVCVCELTEELDVPQPLLSFHLRTLRDAGLVRAARRGRWNFYALDPMGLESAEDFLSDLVATHAATASRVTCCG